MITKMKLWVSTSILDRTYDMVEGQRILLINKKKNVQASGLVLS